MQIAIMPTAKYEKLAKKLTKVDSLSERLAFDGYKLPYHESEKTYYLPVNRENAEWETGEFSVWQKKDDVKVFFLEDFTKESKQALLAQNRKVPLVFVSKKEYTLGYLTFTGLPMMTFSSLEEVAEDGNPLFEMTLYESCDKKDWITNVFTTATIRGNTSKEYEKKSLRLKLKKKKEDGSYHAKQENLLQIRDDDDWILNSLYADNSRIRDKLCMDLWHQTGAYQNPYQANFGVMGEYTEVVINDGYAGLFLLTHPIDAKQVHMDRTSKQIESGEALIERIYKRKYPSAWSEEDYYGAFPDPNLNNFRGGFFLKGDVISGELAEWQPLRSLAACIESDDTTFQNEIGQIVDQNNAVDNWLFFQAIGGFDNENKNVYYIARNREEQYYGYFIPWDMNLSFGSVYADNAYYSEESMKEVHTIVQFEPANRMLNLDVPGCRAYAKQTWNTWREAVFSDEALLDRIEMLQNKLLLSGALTREKNRWSNGNTSEDISLLKEYAIERMHFVDTYLQNW